MNIGIRLDFAPAIMSIWSLMYGQTTGTALSHALEYPWRNYNRPLEMRSLHGLVFPLTCR